MEQRKKPSYKPQTSLRNPASRSPSHNIQPSGPGEDRRAGKNSPDKRYSIKKPTVNVDKAKKGVAKNVRRAGRAAGAVGSGVKSAAGTTGKVLAGAGRDYSALSKKMMTGKEIGASKSGPVKGAQVIDRSKRS